MVELQDVKKLKLGVVPQTEPQTMNATRKLVDKKA